MSWGEPHTGPGDATGLPLGPPISTPEERVAGQIIAAAERAARGILDAAHQTAQTIIDGANAVPTALSTPPAEPLDAETLARIIENLPQFNQPDYGGPGLQYDPRVDTLVDENGALVELPEWEQPGGDDAVTVPDPTRQSFDIVTPGSEIAPGIPRLDLP